MKKRIEILVTIVLVLLLITPIYGRCEGIPYNYHPQVADVSFSADKTSVKRGDSITFNIVLDEMPGSLNQIDASGFVLAYDGEFFENFYSRESGRYASYSIDDPKLKNNPNRASMQGKEIIYVTSGALALGNIFSFTLDVKANTTLNNGTITLYDDVVGETFVDAYETPARFRNDSYPITITVDSQNPDNPTPDDPTPSTVAVKGITVSPTNKEVKVGETFTIQPTISPANATNKNITWSSSNSRVASVSNSGKVTANAEGAATITAKTNDGNYTATCTVTVVKATEPDNPADPSAEVKVTGVTIDKPTASVRVGEKVQLTAIVAPSDATNKNVTWSSSDTSIATVSTSGLVTGVKKGQANITVTTVDGSMTAEATISVTDGDIIIDVEDNRQNAEGTTDSGDSSNSGTKDSTTAKDRIPQTGQTFIIGAALIVLSSVAIVSYRKIKLNNDIK